MSSPGLFYYNDKWGKTDPKVTTLVWRITAATTVVSVPMGPPVLATFGPLSQDQIDSFLGTSSEFTQDQFDATSMGTDAFGCVINMEGQAAFAVGFEISSVTGALGSTIVSRASLALGLAGSTLQTAMALGSDGNLAFQAVITGLDALTEGLIIAKIYWIAQ